MIAFRLSDKILISRSAISISELISYQLFVLCFIEPGECPENCPLIYQPMCGNDGRLYPSECELKLTACRTNSVIKRLKGKKAKRICGRFNYDF